MEEELLSLPVELQARYLRIVELLEEFGPAGVGMPHVRYLGNRLWEMRMRGHAANGRAICISTEGQLVVVLHAFQKKSQRIPRRAMELARRRSREVRSWPRSR